MTSRSSNQGQFRSPFDSPSTRPACGGTRSGSLRAELPSQVIEGRSFNAGLSDARYKYLAKEHDTETGLEWLEARGYDVRIGRFLTIDPLSELFPNTGAYTYAHNNPITWSDPSGLADTIGSEKYPIPLPEVIVQGENKCPVGFIGSYDGHNHRLRYQADQQIATVLSRRNWYALLADAIRSVTYSTSLESVTPDEIQGLDRAYHGSVSPLVQRVTNMLLARLAKAGTAISPFIQSWVLSVVTNFLSAQNPVGPQLCIDYRRGTEADTVFYDATRGDMIMELFFKKLRDNDSTLVRATFSY